jgi:hypothetical protein
MEDKTADFSAGSVFVSGNGGEVWWWLRRWNFLPWKLTALF